MIGFFSGLFMSAVSLFHPFYISMTDLEYNNKTKTLQVSVRIFTDDLEKTLRKNCNCKVDLTQTEKKSQMNSLINNYLQQHLAVRINNKNVNLQFIGFQNEEESTWSYFEAATILPPKQIVINNSLLHDYKTEQINMLHIKAQGKEITEKLNYPNQLFEIKL